MDKGDETGAAKKLTGKPCPTMRGRTYTLCSSRLSRRSLIGGTKNEIAAKRKLIQVLEDQKKVQQRVAALKETQAGNAKTETGDKLNDDADKAFKQQAEQARQAAEAEEKAFEEKYKEAVSALQEAEKQKIDATKTGSMARIAAIEAAIKEEQSKGLQDTAYYKELQLAKVNAVKDRAQMQEKIETDIAKASMDNETKMAALTNATEDQQAKFQTRDAAKHRATGIRRRGRF